MLTQGSLSVSLKWHNHNGDSWPMSLNCLMCLPLTNTSIFRGKVFFRCRFVEEFHQDRRGISSFKNHSGILLSSGLLKQVWLGFFLHFVLLVE